MDTAETGAAAGTPARSRRAALAVLATGQLMLVVDGTGVAVALPRIRADLGLAGAQLSWVVNGYLVAFGGLLLLCGRLGDLLGRRRMFLTGIAVFTAASALCGAAGGAALLIAARFAQGVGCAMAGSVITGMAVLLYPEGRDRVRAITVLAFVAAAGGSVGALGGGVLTELLGWPSVFLVNLPIGALLLLFGRRTLAPDRGLGWGAGADLLGAALVTAGLMLLVFALGALGPGGPGPALPAALAAAGLVLLAGFAARQRRAAAPLLDPAVLRSRTRAGGTLLTALFVGAMFGFQYLVTLYLQEVLGLDSLETGLAYLLASAVIGATSLALAGPLIARFGVRRVLLAGLAAGVLAFGWLARVPESGGFAADVLPAMLALGVSAGLVLPAATALVMAGATGADSGVRSGVVGTAQQVGGALGLAALAALAAAVTGPAGDGAPGPARSAALTDGYRIGFAAGGLLLVLAAAVALALPRDGRPAGRPAGQV
ncbi:MFS transporter [Actinomadura parmotrematis]|uniref:MFS transporter n=1 Tax=Actinomadura parmotrematis TaxID=2864039 RepID=A0ABS7FLL0_9ACTN|nr:MFS transporter [Actinomadura parmotrematis]MBW8481267.1 MFS transporter [Actinomadura parmotrematis]